MAWERLLVTFFVMKLRSLIAIRISFLKAGSNTCLRQAFHLRKPAAKVMSSDKLIAIMHIAIWQFAKLLSKSLFFCFFAMNFNEFLEERGKRREERGKRYAGRGHENFKLNFKPNFKGVARHIRERIERIYRMILVASLEIVFKIIFRIINHP